MESRVDAVIKKEKRRFSCKPDDGLFYAKRLWDHHSEHGFMNDVEVSFQRVADKIVNGHWNLNKADSRAISDFNILWKLRQRERSQRNIHVQFPGYKGKKVVIDKDRQERHEKRGVLYWDQWGEIPNRMLTGTSLEIQLLAERERNQDYSWGVFIAKPEQGEFLVPDRSLYAVVPVSPTICLVSNERSRFVGFSFVARLNGMSVENAENYYFAQNIEKCPILLGATLHDELIRSGFLKNSLILD